MKFIPAKSKRQLLCHNEEQKFQAFRAEGVGTFLSVGCDARGAFYERIIKLEEAEEKKLESEGVNALTVLAAEVAFGGHADREWKDGRHHKVPDADGPRSA